MHIEEIYSEKPAFTPKHLKLTFETKEDINRLKEILQAARRGKQLTTMSDDMAYKLLKELDKL